MLIPSVSIVIRNKLPQDSGSRAGCHKGNIELFLGRRQQTVSDNFITYTEPSTLRGSPHATPRRADGMSGAGFKPTGTPSSQIMSKYHSFIQDS